MTVDFSGSAHMLPEGKIHISLQLIVGFPAAVSADAARRWMDAVQSVTKKEWANAVESIKKRAK